MRTWDCEYWGIVRLWVWTELWECESMWQKLWCIKDGEGNMKNGAEIEIWEALNWWITKREWSIRRRILLPSPSRSIEFSIDSEECFHFLNISGTKFSDAGNYGFSVGEVETSALLQVLDEEQFRGMVEITRMASSVSGEAPPTDLLMAWGDHCRIAPLIFCIFFIYRRNALNHGFFLATKSHGGSWT